MPSIADILLEQGQALANARRAQGAISAQMWGNLGNTIAAVPGQLQQAQTTAEQQQIRQAQVGELQQRGSDLKALDTAYAQPGGRDAILNSLPGHLRPQVEQHFQEADENAAKVQDADIKAQTAAQDYIGSQAATIRKYGYDPAAAQMALSHAKDAFQHNPAMLSQVSALEQQIQANPTPQAIQQIIDPLIPPQLMKLGKDESLIDLSKPQGSNVVASGPPPPPTEPELALKAAQGDTTAQGAMGLLKPSPQKSYQHATVLLDGKPADVLIDPDPKSAQKVFDLNGQAIDNAATRVRPIPPAQTGNAEQEQGNAKTVAAGIIAGDTAPSILEGTRGTAQGLALMAEIKRQGGDSDKILRNWMATKGAIRALDSNQQVRLAEVINKASSSLDKLDELNQQWSDNASRWGIKALNRASLTAAQNGVYGPEAASVATRLDSQIADVTSELGQSVMGGNSPTDHALSLASKNLSSDWTQPVLSDAIKQVRYNLNLAQNARNDLLGQMGVTSTQVQTPPAAGLPPKFTAKNAQGLTITSSDGVTWKDAQGNVVK